MTLKEEFELDIRDTIILQKLSQKLGGFGFNELLRETKLPRNTLTRHLRYLVKEKIVSRRQLGRTSNSPVVYKAVISDELRNIALGGLAIAINLHDIDFEKMSKIQLVSMIPHLISGIAVYQTIWMNDYIVHKINRMEFQFAMKLFSNFIDELKITFKELLNKKDYARLEKEAWIVYSNESSRTAHITYLAKDHTMKYRTVSEIVRDLETLFAVTDSSGGYMGAEGVPQYRYQIERDKKKQVELIEEEQNYANARNKLADLQAGLKGTSAFHIDFKLTDWRTGKTIFTRDH